LYKLQKYCFDWQLTVNIYKTKILTFQKTFSPNPMPFYDHKPLTETKEYNFLGTVIDHKGCFKRGIQELSKKRFKSFIFFAKTVLKF
jgi:hypothetical protein